MNGSRNLIVQYNIVADGSGDYSNFELLNVTDYTGEDSNQPTDFKVKHVSGRNGVGVSFQLRFGSLSDSHRLFFESTTDDSFAQVWEGGLTTQVIDSDMTVRITTSGFDGDGDSISLVIWAQKKRSNANA